ncbi:MAG: aspartate-semialdehyde dehydrogenase [Archangium gephyra]|uniref:Aspartate-semialdehyde dehydrogenase n=1 Tax=Archangium gephyra TaxID=48 RepID=A0A2W5UWH1_9BACT|nr:MAG: aspartate-semialdehyde dehydrogenase [Archangium gephyra]
MSEPTIAVVGATGTVGKQVIASLMQHDVEPDQVRFFSSERTQGEELDYQEETLPTEPPREGSFRDVQAVILATPSPVARELALDAQRSGAWVVDLSGAFRVDANVPLVAPGVNDGVLDRAFSGRIVSIAHPATQTLLATLGPLRAKFGLAFADVTMLFGASSRGNQGMEQLTKQTAGLLNAKDPDIEVFPHRIGFNVIPAVGGFEGGLNEGERHVLVEAARIWSGEALPALTATALTVPTYHGLTMVISAHLNRPVDADGVRALLKEDTALKVIDDPSQNVYPMPMLSTDDVAPHVGRIRAAGPRVQLVVAVDSVWRLADTAVDVALELADRS